ncbi:biosynthetic peptidoglycan transglycosylase [Jiella sonneratiae]|uniref:Biosynthetic peptidoglycan transglycosylase n=1 Tax=Jiella sonneratiae TaxID=2816856 RepID=A0ABS3J2A9_9HYPH|nr:transglycosylase domain-containing protein [Jiella sonneratiae]MBO0903795.1 monofunctional biosynthetic peptidoglycan transglycosylase [Jiella sonneratiae]
MISRAKRIAVGVAVVVLVAVAIPLVLTPIYAIRGVHPVSTLMLWDEVTVRPVLRDWVPIDDVAPVLLHSVIMSEDGQFCRHHGVDWGELLAVVDQALDGEETRGASTITMQTVKNLFLWNDRSFVRKGLELPLAVYFDFVLPKRRIMEIYVNIAEWDTGVYGIEAASQHYFGKPASKLTAHEAALITVSLPAPDLRNPADPSPTMRRLARRVERLARSSGAYVGCVGKD